MSLTREPVRELELDPRLGDRIRVQDLGDGRQTMTMSMGPQHPSTHGVLRVVLTLDGETVVDAQPDIGYLHRNWEKIAEYMTYAMTVPFSDRNDYLAAITNELALVQAVEKLTGIEVPERAQILRVIFSELQRITSHLLWFGTFGLDLGAVTPFLHAFTAREYCYRLFEKATGARFLYGYLRIGGMRNDVPDGWLDDLLSFLDQLERTYWPEFMRLLIDNAIFIRRTKGIGVLKPEDAVAYAASGPVLRGSGIRHDVRKADNYLPYDRFEFDIPVGENGDVYDRAVVRMYEMLESAKIIRQAVKELPDGPVMAKVPRAIRPYGEVYHRVEGPRGEVGVYLVAAGDTNAYRARWRSPCFVNLQLLPLLARGHLVADVVAIIGSIDIVLGEVDR